MSLGETSQSTCTTGGTPMVELGDCPGRKKVIYVLYNGLKETKIVT